MTFREVKKDTYIINSTIRGTRPWWVAGKFNGYILIRRNPKIGKCVALAPGQLRGFKLCSNQP